MSEYFYSFLIMNSFISISPFRSSRTKSLAKLTPKREKRFAQVVAGPTRLATRGSAQAAQGGGVVATRQEEEGRQKNLSTDGFSAGLLLLQLCCFFRVLVVSRRRDPLYRFARSPTQLTCSSIIRFSLSSLRGFRGECRSNLVQMCGEERQKEARP